jgi:hypothetical protein
MSIIKLYTVSTAGVLATASVDIPANGIIRTITVGLFNYDTAPGTSNEQSAGELSFLSAPQYASNDVRGSLCQVAAGLYFADAARLALAGTPFCILTPIAVKVAAGERVYLHVTSGGSAVASAVSYLFIDDGIDVARAQVRRR